MTTIGMEDEALFGDETRLLTRRAAIGCGALTFTAATLLGGPDLAMAATKRVSATSDGYVRSRFAPYAGTSVLLSAPGRSPLGGVFIAAEDLPALQLKGSEDAFALRFRGPRSITSEQQTITVGSALFGNVALFVTLADVGTAEREYIAVVNRVVPKR